MIKNILKTAMLLVTATVLSSGGVIDENNSEKTGTVSIGYNVEPSYTVTIPANVVFTNTDSGKTAERPLQANDVLLESGQQLNIYVESLNGFKMVNHSGYIEYSMMANAAEITGTDKVKILTVMPGDKSGWVLLNFETKFVGDFSGYAGEYSDTLTFTVEMI